MKTDRYGMGCCSFAAPVLLKTHDTNIGNYTRKRVEYVQRSAPSF